jgi:hypothetical protein
VGADHLDVAEAGWADRFVAFLANFCLLWACLAAENGIVGRGGVYFDGFGPYRSSIVHLDLLL